ncbi:MAG TPA: hypothetical protein VFI28_02825 [Candidatus Limnocylindrales bacterium]|nr:hypothetical protein [Candidatus Limnocylindrales bacterium]
MANHRTSFSGDLLRGAIAGAVATWAMDQVTTSLLEQASDSDKAQEKAVQPRGRSSARNLTDMLVDQLGIDASEDQRSQAATAVHWCLGIVPGALYGALRRRVPLLGAGRGLVYGTVLFLGNDEYLNSELGFAADPGAYPASTHVRGFVGHLVLGAATDTVCDLLGG